MKWFRLYHDLPSDRKLRKFSAQEKWAWVCLLCFASQSSQRGIVIGEEEEILAEDCGFSSVQDFQYYLDKLRQKGWIEPLAGGFKIVNWDKLQYASDSSKERVKRHRKEKCNVTETLPKQPSNVSVTPPDTEQIQNQNTEQIQSKADPEREDAPRSASFADRDFENLPKQPTATEQKSQLTAKLAQPTPEKNSTQEITAIPRRIFTENGQQGTSTLSRDVTPVYQKIGILQGRIEADHREALIDEAIATYNQFRGAWGECVELPEGYRNRLYQVFYRQRAEDKRGAFLALVRDATLWAARSQWLAKPEFENKNFLFLIGRNLNEKIAEYAANWRSLSNDSKVGMAIKLSQPKEKEWHDLSGKPCDEGIATIAWYALSRKAKKEPENITQHEIDWANYYFPGHDIFTKIELHDD